eukprot:TRINITY_DN16027_c0_g1_i1.p1 TRINITY_DN16027_c0_g1~~TRINITY_DN16027_c0_g1_i1.p1  ORF type:complete len:131 (+),score=10.69 TRINITY_DN16027_c0_g1_i1:178-570(+)
MKLILFILLCVLSFDFTAGKGLRKGKKHRKAKGLRSDNTPRSSASRKFSGANVMPRSNSLPLNPGETVIPDVDIAFPSDPHYNPNYVNLPGPMSVNSEVGGSSSSSQFSSNTSTISLADDEIGEQAAAAA